MKQGNKKVCKIEDPRLINYTKRTRSGRTQTFYTGDDSRDFERYNKERYDGDGKYLHNVEMHDKPDTLNITPPEKHYYSDLIDGEWWWLNGCNECNGLARGYSYVECEKHDVCSSCSKPREHFKESVWGGGDGWTCKPCMESIEKTAKDKALSNFDEENFDEWNYRLEDEAKCPYCDARNVFEYDGDDSPNPIDCHTCGNEFSIELDFEIKYTTKRIKPKT